MRQSTVRRHPVPLFPAPKVGYRSPLSGNRPAPAYFHRAPRTTTPRTPTTRPPFPAPASPADWRCALSFFLLLIRFHARLCLSRISRVRGSSAPPKYASSTCRNTGGAPDTCAKSVIQERSFRSSGGSNTLEPVQNLSTHVSTHVWLASFPPYFAKILVNTQSIACGFGVIWRKN